MLNRRHLRIKVLQALYAYHKANKGNYSAGEKELFFSINKMYDLYVFYLLLFDELRAFGEFRIEENKKKRLPSEEDLNPNLKFVNNAIVRLMGSNKMLLKASEDQKINWVGEQELVRKLYYAMVEDEVYQDYMSTKDTTFEADRDFALKIFKKHIANFELIHHFFEEKSIYWMDDIDFVCSMVLKTIKQFDEQSDEYTPILNLYKDEKDEKTFTRTLFRRCITTDEETQELIKHHSDNWEIERIAVMDVLLMKLALTEAQEFETIPLKVTLNEYIDISKFYSTPKSKGFINGILDKAFADLKNKGEIKKIGRGLIG